MKPNFRSLVKALLADIIAKLAEFSGAMVDLRDVPRAVQEIAFAKSTPPYIPETVVWEMLRVPAVSTLQAGRALRGDGRIPHKVDLRRTARKAITGA